jgi:hypothetical protein
MKTLLALAAAVSLLVCTGFDTQAQTRCVAKCQKYCKKYDPGGGEFQGCMNKCQTRYGC